MRGLLPLQYGVKGGSLVVRVGTIVVFSLLLLFLKVKTCGCIHFFLHPPSLKSSA